MRETYESPIVINAGAFAANTSGTGDASVEGLAAFFRIG